MSKSKIRRDDQVKVISGKNKGKIGKVLKVLRGDGTVIVEKVNMVTRQVKPQGDRPGGAVEKEAPLHVSNVALWNADTESTMRAGWRMEDGKKVRFDRKTGNTIE